MYWTDNRGGKIQRADLRTNQVEDLVTGLASPHSLIVDSIAGRMYWSNEGTNELQSANLDGGQVEMILLGTAPRNIALDTTDQRLYWEDGREDIHRLDLGDQSVDVVVSAVRPTGLAIDSGTRTIYWTSFSEGGRIQRRSLDGGDIEDLVTTGLGDVGNPTIDDRNGKLYWTNAFTSSSAMIERANLDGTGRETVVTIRQSFGLAVDAQNQQIYWTDPSGPVIHRVGFDGSCEENLVDSGVVHPGGIDLVVVPEPLLVLLHLAALVVILGLRRR